MASGSRYCVADCASCRAAASACRSVMVAFIGSSRGAARIARAWVTANCAASRSRRAYSDTNERVPVSHSVGAGKARTQFSTAVRASKETETRAAEMAAETRSRLLVGKASQRVDHGLFAGRVKNHRAISGARRAGCSRQTSCTVSTRPWRARRSIRPDILAGGSPTSGARAYSVSLEAPPRAATQARTSTAVSVSVIRRRWRSTLARCAAPLATWPPSPVVNSWHKVTAHPGRPAAWSRTAARARCPVTPREVTRAFMSDRSNRSMSRRTAPGRAAVTSSALSGQVVATMVKACSALWRARRSTRISLIRVWASSTTTAAGQEVSSSSRMRSACACSR